MQKILVLMGMGVTGILLGPSPAHPFCFAEAGSLYQVPPLILWAIAETESNFHPTAVNYNPNQTIDVGTMQVNSRWAPQLGATWQYQFDPCTNVKTAAWILRQCYAEFGNSWPAVGCYHSHTPALRDAYAAKIAALLQTLGKAAPRE